MVRHSGRNRTRERRNPTGYLYDVKDGYAVNKLLTGGLPLTYLILMNNHEG